MEWKNTFFTSEVSPFFGFGSKTLTYKNRYIFTLHSPIKIIFGSTPMFSRVIFQLVMVLKSYMSSFYHILISLKGKYTKRWIFCVFMFLLNLIQRLTAGDKNSQYKSYSLSSSSSSISEAFSQMVRVPPKIYLTFAQHCIHP